MNIFFNLLYIHYDCTVKRTIWNKSIYPFTTMLLDIFFPQWLHWSHEAWHDRIIHPHTLFQFLLKCFFSWPLGKLAKQIFGKSWEFGPRRGGTVGQEAVELICQNARKMRQNAAMSLWPLLTTKMKLICMEVLKKMTFSQKTFLTLSMVTLANRGHKTASRAEPIFWGQTDLTQWCHISPISWGNSGYINPYAKYNKCWCWINSTA